MVGAFCFLVEPQSKSRKMIAKFAAQISPGLATAQFAFF
jgi:hypothetical protein